MGRNYYIALSSITHAYKAKEILGRHGIKVFIKKTSKDIGKKGCGYSISFQGNLDKALSILRFEDIKVVNIYSE